MASHNQNTFYYLQQITNQLLQQGIPILLGSDAGVLLSPHGLATHKELELLVDSGLTPYQALQSATILPAKALNKSDEFGEIKVGLNANLIFSQNNPVEDISVLKYPDAVVFDNQWLSSTRLEELRQDAIDQQSFWSELWLLLSNY